MMANGPTLVVATPEFAPRWILRQFKSGKLRVASFSAFLVNIDISVRDGIIRHTELKFAH